MGLRAVLWIAVGVLIAIFVFQNTAVVEIRLFFWQVSLSRVLLLGGALIVGFLAGIAAAWEWFGKKRRSAGRKSEESVVVEDLE